MFRYEIGDGTKESGRNYQDVFALRSIPVIYIYSITLDSSSSAEIFDFITITNLPTKIKNYLINNIKSIAGLMYVSNDIDIPNQGC